MLVAQLQIDLPAILSLANIEALHVTHFIMSSTMIEKALD